MSRINELVFTMCAVNILIILTFAIGSGGVNITSMLPDVVPSASTPPLLSLTPSPVATVVTGQPLILTVTLLVNTSTTWRLEWSTSVTVADMLGLITSSQIKKCPENGDVTKACLMDGTTDVTIVQFRVENPGHNDDLYCTLLLGENSNPTILTTHTIIYIIVPVEYVNIHSFNGDSDQITLKEGDNITFHCETAPSRPATAISWFRDDLNITLAADEDRCNKEDGLFRTSQNLTIQAKRTNTMGMTRIRCEAVNGSTAVQSNEIELTILSFPARPNNLQIDSINTAEVRLTWNLHPESVYHVNFTIDVQPETPGLIIGRHSYEENKQIESESHEEDAVDFTPEVLYSSRICGLHPNEIYNISLTAFNVVGTSLPVSLIITVLQDDGEVRPMSIFFVFGVVLMVLSSVILVTIVIVICNRGRLPNFCMPLTLPVTCHRKAAKDPEPVYEDLAEIVSKSNAPAIEKRLRHSRKSKGASKHNQTMSGVYASIASTIDVAEQKESSGGVGNIYEDILGGCTVRAQATSSHNMKPAVPPNQISDKKKRKPIVSKKPTLRKPSIVAAGSDCEIPDTTAPSTPDNMASEGMQDNREHEQTVETPSAVCVYMDMRSPVIPQETEYVEVQSKTC